MLRQAIWMENFNNDGSEYVQISYSKALTAAGYKFTKNLEQSVHKDAV